MIMEVIAESLNMRNAFLSPLWREVPGKEDCSLSASPKYRSIAEFTERYVSHLTIAPIR